MQGASRWPSETLDITSVISSSVPVPPGNAIKASPSSIILVLRSVMSWVTMSLVRPSYCTSESMKNWGSTPVTSPPAVRTLWARRPIRPLREPP